MPEGPEVRRAADRIQRAIGGTPLHHVQILTPKLHIPEHVFLGKTLRRVHTYSKAFVLEFDNDVCIYVHLQLYGVWKTGRIRTPPKTRRSLRIRFENETHYAALYSATDIEGGTKLSILEHPYIKKLGPDLLSQPTFGVGHVSRRLGKKKFARRSLGALLLDQSFFAGIGNYLRSEILFVAGIQPNRTLGTLDSKEKKALARAIHTMLHRAYKTGGVTVEQSFVEQLKATGETRRSYRHYVFAREGHSCRRCAAQVEKKKVSGRRLYFCAGCQVG